jgi:ubiquinone biosynthesis protein
MSPRAVRVLGGPLLATLVRRALVGRPVGGVSGVRTLTRADVGPILRRLWAHFDDLTPGIPWEPTFGSRMNVALAALTVAAHRAFREAGIPDSEAGDLIKEIAWRVYRTWALLPGAIARLIARHPVKRLSVATGLFRRFPFNPPGYRMEDVPVAGAVAFDVYRCPVADYFRVHGLGPLCVRTWCALDEPLAGMWGGALERQGTLAGGAVRCDFRWLPRPRKGADGAGEGRLHARRHHG